MADRMQQYADWLVANQNKAGTPEFTTVANAYKQLRQPSSAATPEKDTSFSSAFQYGIDAPLENMATTAQALGMEGTADTLSGLTSAPQNYESAAERFINPQEGDAQLFGYGVGYLPRAAAEQAGQFAGSLASRAGGAALGGAITGGNPLGVAAGAVAAPALFEAVQVLGSAALKSAQNDGREEPNWEDWSRAAAVAGASGLLNSIGVGGVGGLNRVLRETATEAGQSATEQVGTSVGTEAGLQLDPKQAIGEGIIGGTAAGGVQAPISAVKGTVKATRAAVNLVSNKESKPQDDEAAADVATDIQFIADDAGYDLDDVDASSATGANATINRLHTEYSENLKSLARTLRQRLNFKDTDPESVRLDKVIAKTARRAGKNKAKDRVTPSDFKTVRKLVGDTAEGEQMLALLRKSNELTRVQNAGLKGGVSQYTDALNPLDPAVGYSNAKGFISPLLGMGSLFGAISSAGASIPLQAGAVIGGRYIDNKRGTRSKVANFVREQQGKTGINAPTQPSLATQNTQSEALKAAQQAQEAARQRNLNIEMLRRNEPPKGDPTDPNPSPEYLFMSQLGLDRRGVSDLLKIVSRTRPDLKDAVQSYYDMQKNGTQVRDINRLLGALKKVHTDQGGTLPNNLPSVSSPLAEARRQQGIRSNQERIADLRDAASVDNNLSDFDKGVINDALDKFGKSLGADPVKEANRILKDAEALGRNKDKIREYLKPYVDNVERQQKASKRLK